MDGPKSEIIELADAGYLAKKMKKGKKNWVGDFTASL